MGKISLQEEARIDTSNYWRKVKSEFSNELNLLPGSLPGQGSKKEICLLYARSAFQINLSAHW